MSKKATEQKPQNSLISDNSKVTVTIAWSDIQPVYQKVLTKAAQKLKAPGFRQGKVPAALAESMLNQAALFEQVLQEIFPPAYMTALQKDNKLPISQPELEPISMEKGKDWSFTVYFAERPTDLKLGDYKKAVKAAVKEAEKEIAEEKAKEKQEDIKLKHIFKALIDQAKPKVPELLVRQEVNHELQHLADQLEQLHIDPDQYLQSRQLTIEQLRQEYAVSAFSSLQLEFLLAEIAKEEKIIVEDKEVDAMLDKVTGGKLTPEQHQRSQHRSYIFSTLLKQKVIKNLLEAA